MQAVLILVTLWGSLLAATCGGRGAVFKNHEFGFRALVPGILPRCIAQTDSHIHGIGTVLVGNERENRAGVPAFSLWADYNSAFAPSAIDDLRTNPACKGAAVGWAKDELATAPTTEAESTPPNRSSTHPRLFRLRRVRLRSDRDEMPLLVTPRPEQFDVHVWRASVGALSAWSQFETVWAP